MKTLRFFPIAAAVGPLLILAPRPALAHPGTSPSARAAARLKYNPPRNWIRYYLGDDRYKIRGGTWKVVSTENDRYYYPAWAPEMLSQVRVAPGRVIGFASAHDAEEAGYLRSNYPMESPTLGIEGSAAPASPSPPGTTTTTQNGMNITVAQGKARRIVLSDGVSTTILPVGWAHITLAQNVAAGTRNLSITSDLFSPAPYNPRAQRNVAFGFLTVPGINAEAMLKPESLQKMSQSFNRTGMVNNQVNRAVNGFKTTPATLGGLRGVIYTGGAPGVSRNVPITVVARGSKVYYSYNTARSIRGASQIISAFRPR